MFILILLLFIPTQVLANAGELFGASASAIAIGNQPSGKDASDHYYAPALLSSHKTNYSLGMMSIIPKTKEIDNIIIKSPMNSNSTPPYQYGDVEQNKSTLHLFYLHALFPFISKTKLGVSLFLPFKKFAEISTGDTYLPEYAMYRSRNNRTLFNASLISPLTETFSASLGFYTGLQSSGETELIGRNSGSDEPSSGKLVFNASPSTALTFSLSKEWKNAKAYFSFQDYMKSEFKNKAYGYTPLDNTASSFPYNLNLNSLLYFDPRIVRLGYIHQKNRWSFFTMLEYQDWSEYDTPKLKLENNGGVIVSSHDFEKISTNNVFIPHLGMSYHFESSELHGGLSYRPRVIESNLSEGGNTIDTDLFNLSLGYSLSFNFLEKELTFHTTYLLQKLKEYDVHKTDGREDGETGEKLGSPGYSVGGEIHVLSFGLSWVI